MKNNRRITLTATQQFMVISIIKGTIALRGDTHGGIRKAYSYLKEQGVTCSERWVADFYYSRFPDDEPKRPEQKRAKIRLSSKKKKEVVDKINDNISSGDKIYKSIRKAAKEVGVNFYTAASLHYDPWGTQNLEKGGKD